MSEHIAIIGADGSMGAALASPAQEGAPNTRPWLKHYDVGVPFTLHPYPERTLLDAVSDTARQRPDHPALFFKGARLSYAGLEALSDAFAAALAAHGFRKGDRLALLLPNSPQSIIAQIGGWKAGGIVVPLNPLYSEAELEHALSDSGVTAALVLTPYYAKLKALQPRTALRLVIATNIKEYLPPALRLAFSLTQEKKDGHRITLHPEDFWLADVLRRQAGAPRPAVPVHASDPALLLFSGGTTGTPKGVVSTHGGLLAAGLQIHAWFGTLLVDWDDILMAVMPLFHTYGNIGVITTCLVGHNPMAIVPNPRDLADLIATIRKLRPAFLPGVPTLFNALANRPEVQAGQVDLKCIKLCISGAAPLLAETKSRFEALTGGRLVEGYALTETVMASVISPVGGACKPGAVGLPLPDVEVRIVDADTGQATLPANQVGEILMRAPQMMQGYWNRPAESAEVLRDGWLFTGDLGYLDDDGYLFIVDRKKDLIKPGGFQVWPREVEEVIAAHPAVADVGVAGVRDAYQGEAVKAWVVLRAGQQVTADELNAYCRRQLAGYKVPKYIEFREALPKTTIGKVSRRELAKGG